MRTGTLFLRRHGTPRGLLTRDLSFLFTRPPLLGGTGSLSGCSLALTSSRSSVAPNSKSCGACYILAEISGSCVPRPSFQPTLTNREIGRKRKVSEALTPCSPWLARSNIHRKFGASSNLSEPCELFGRISPRRSSFSWATGGSGARSSRRQFGSALRSRCWGTWLIQVLYSRPQIFTATSLVRRVFPSLCLKPWPTVLQSLRRGSAGSRRLSMVRTG